MFIKANTVNEVDSINSSESNKILIKNLEKVSHLTIPNTQSVFRQNRKQHSITATGNVYIVLRLITGLFQIFRPPDWKIHFENKRKLSFCATNLTGSHFFYI